MELKYIEFEYDDKLKYYIYIRFFLFDFIN